MEKHIHNCQCCADLQQPTAKMVVQGPDVLGLNLIDVSGKAALTERRQLFQCRECAQQYRIRLTALQKRFPDGGDADFNIATPQTFEDDDGADKTVPKTGVARILAIVVFLIWRRTPKGF